MIGSPAVYAIRARNTLKDVGASVGPALGTLGLFGHRVPALASGHAMGSAPLARGSTEQLIRWEMMTTEPVFGDGVQKSKIPTRLEFVRGSFTYVSN